MNRRDGQPAKQLKMLKRITGKTRRSLQRVPKSSEPAQEKVQKSLSLCNLALNNNIYYLLRAASTKDGKFCGEDLGQLSQIDQ